MDKITFKQKEIMKHTFFEIHEFIRKKQWECINNDKITSKYTPTDILFEIDEYPGTVTKCSYEDFEKAVCLEDSGVTATGIWGLASIWLDGKESDLSIECFFTFEGDILMHTTINKVHVL